MTWGRGTSRLLGGKAGAHEFSVGHVELEGPVDYPSGNVQEAGEFVAWREAQGAALSKVIWELPTNWQLEGMRVLGMSVDWLYPGYASELLRTFKTYPPGPQPRPESDFPGGHVQFSNCTGDSGAWPGLRTIACLKVVSCSGED